MQDKILIPYLLYISFHFRIFCTYTHLNEFSQEKVFYILQHQAKPIQCNFSKMIYLREMERHTQRRKKIDFSNWKEKKKEAKKGYTILCLFMQYRRRHRRPIWVCKQVLHVCIKNKHQVNTSKLSNTSSSSRRRRLYIFSIFCCNVSGLAYLICLTRLYVHTTPLAERRRSMVLALCDWISVR